MSWDSGLCLVVKGGRRELRRDLQAGSRLSIGFGPSWDVSLERDGSLDERFSDDTSREAVAWLDCGEEIALEVTSPSALEVNGERLTHVSRIVLAPGDAFSIGGAELLLTRAPSSGRRTWTRDAFEGRVEEECQRLLRGSPGFAVVRLIVSASGVPGDAEEILSSSLRLGDPLAMRAPNDYEALLAATSRAGCSAAVARITRALARRDISARVSSVSAPEDASDAPQILRLLEERLEDIEAVGFGALRRPRLGAELEALVARVALSDISVLILAETGAGKEICAEMIHRASNRSSRPFLRLNCASFSESLLQSELFGHERGSFTGATRTKPGLLEMAQGGTVLLDEVGDLPPALQAMLLRVMDERKLLRVGGLEPRPIDVRFVSATNRDLTADVQVGRFRRDLFYRINGFTIRIPALRDRRDEIPGLAAWLIEDSARRAGRRRAPRITSDALALLERHSWPGNVREMRNVLDRALVLAGDDEDIAAQHVSFQLPLSVEAGARPPAEPEGAVPEALREALTPTTPPDDERDRIAAALDETGGNQTEAASLLGISRRTLVHRLEKYGLPRPRKGSRKGGGEASS